MANKQTNSMTTATEIARALIRCGEVVGEGPAGAARILCELRARPAGSPGEELVNEVWCAFRALRRAEARCRVVEARPREGLVVAQRAERAAKMRALRQMAAMRRR